jgi:hypothetical protein
LSRKMARARLSVVASGSRCSMTCMREESWTR